MRANQFVRLTIDSNFGSPSLIYRPPNGDDVLKVQFEAGFEMELFSGGKSLVRSTTAESTMYSELLIIGLESG